MYSSLIQRYLRPVWGIRYDIVTRARLVPHAHAHIRVDMRLNSADTNSNESCYAQTS